MGGSTSSPMGKTYLSTAVTEDGNLKQLVSNTRIRLEFAEVPNRNKEGPRVYDVLRAYAGCNRLGAAVAAGELLADGRLWIDGVGGTQIGCEPPLRAQDDWLTTFLISKPNWHLNGDQLTLTSARTTITLLDRKIAEPDFPLDGPRWRVGHRHRQGRRPPRSPPSRRGGVDHRRRRVSDRLDPARHPSTPPVVVMSREVALVVGESAGR